jgi:hypothetical protein
MDFAVGGPHDLRLSGVLPRFNGRLDAVQLPPHSFVFHLLTELSITLEHNLLEPVSRSYRWLP